MSSNVKVYNISNWAKALGVTFIKIKLMVGYRLKYSLFKSMRSGSASREGIFKEFITCKNFRFGM